MSRPLRLEFPGALYHVTSRGNERRDIFQDDADRERLLAVLARMVAMLRWRVHAYVLMGNHYHLLLETPEASLARGMRQLNGIYSQGFNRRHRRVGHLMQGRYKAILVEKESHLLELARYVVLNPVRANLAKSARDWKWSSYTATAGLASPPEWLQVDWTLGHFGAPRAAAQERYREFVSKGRKSGSPWELVSHQLLLGSSDFEEDARRRLRAQARHGSEEIARRQRNLARPEAQEIAKVLGREFGIEESDIRRRRGGPVREAFAYLARTESALPLAQIGAFLGVKHWSASHLATSGAERLRSDRRFRERVLRAVEGLHRIT